MAKAKGADARPLKETLQGNNSHNKIPTVRGLTANKSNKTYTL